MSELALTTSDTIDRLRQLSKKPIMDSSAPNVTEAIKSINDPSSSIIKRVYRKQMKPMWKLL